MLQGASLRRSRPRLPSRPARRTRPARALSQPASRPPLQSKVQAAAEGRERQKAGLLELGQGTWSGRPSDPLLDLLDRHDQAS